MFLRQWWLVVAITVAKAEHLMVWHGDSLPHGVKLERRLSDSVVLVREEREGSLRSPEHVIEEVRNSANNDSI